MEEQLVKITERDGEQHNEIVTFPSFEAAIDAMFSSVYHGLKIKPFSEVVEEEAAKERIERAADFKAYEIVKEILRADVPEQRLHLSLARGSSSVLLDKKVLKSICRFYFRASKRKYITILGLSGKHEKYIIESIEDIKHYAAELRNALSMRINGV